MEEIRAMDPLTVTEASSTDGNVTNGFHDLIGLHLAANRQARGLACPPPVRRPARGS
jgi:hypothetical protein